MNCLSIFDSSIAGFINRFRERDQLVVFQHVPKTAGTSAHAALQTVNRGFHWIENTEGHSWEDFLARHRADSVKLLRGHLRKWQLDELDKQNVPFSGICFLRNPVRQAISHFNFCHSNRSARQAWHRENHPNLISFLKNYHKPNFSTRFIVGEVGSVDEAIEKIADRFALVGLTEFFNSGMYLMMNCLRGDYRVLPKKNVDQNVQQSNELVADNVLDLINEQSAIDLAVHDFFLQRYGDVAERIVEYVSTERH